MNDRTEEETKSEEGAITTTNTLMPSAETLLAVGGSSSTAASTQDAAALNLDYVGTKPSVLQLFSLPFSNQSVSVGIHNVEGCLLIDANPELMINNYNGAAATCTTSSATAAAAGIARGQNPKIDNDTNAHQDHDEEETMVVGMGKQQSAALSVITSMIEQGTQQPQQNQQQQQQGSDTHHHHDPTPHPALDKAVEVFEAKSTEPREYMPWEFSGMKMLVGSDAIVYKGKKPETSLTVRVEDAALMRSQLDSYWQTTTTSTTAANNKDGSNIHNPPVSPPRTYAEALRSRHLLVAQEETNLSDGEENDKQDKDSCSNGLDVELDSPSSFQLQTAILPLSNNLPLAGKFTISPAPMPRTGGSSITPSSSSSSLTPSSPMYTCIDAYLDQLIANVPQLALVLREKGFVQSVKLMQTEHISALLQKETYDTSNPFEIINLQNKTTTTTTEQDVFDPKVLKMNATSLLSFLKANCTKDNATYLLHREAGQSSIQLLDISSQQRQKKWIWVLAMMSYRFAQRLRHISEHLAASEYNDKTASSAGTTTTASPSATALARSFRSRERSLLLNTLSLLEEFADISGQPHEMLQAEVCEKLADTFLRATSTSANNNNGEESKTGDALGHPQSSTNASPIMISKTLQPKYSSVRPDSLSKALDHLVKGTGVLWKLWKRQVQEKKKGACSTHANDDDEKEESSVDNANLRSTVVSIEADSDDEDEDAKSGEEEDSELEALVKAEALAFQLMPLQDKIIDIALRLAEHHLEAYWSSSAMQSLRKAARTMADAMEICQFVATKSPQEDNHELLAVWKHRLQLQFTRTWELCGHFARSFAEDDLWRERGHAAGDDVVAVLRDAEIALPLQHDRPMPPPQQGDSSRPRAEDVFTPFEQDLLEAAGDLFDLSGIIESSEAGSEAEAKEAAEAARNLLENKRQLGRDKRRVLVAACISYSRAVAAYGASINFHRHKGRPQGGASKKPTVKSLEPLGTEEAVLLNLLRQRLGDSQNELGKLFLKELHDLLSTWQSMITQNHDHNEGSRKVDKRPAEPLLASAQNCFFRGLDAFEKCNDAKNVVLLRCNLCQCYKLRANSNFATSNSVGKTTAKGTAAISHADVNLKKAVQQLEAAHEMLGQRYTDPPTWDMVSNELAATLLVLGVRRRQALIGGGSAPSLLHIVPLAPGQTRSIVEPMEKALSIYEQSGNLRQAAAVNYQLAQFYSKTWVSQRDEAQTREKLSLAFRYYTAAHNYLYSNFRGNESTFVLLCIDLSNLYSTVSGEAAEEGHRQALLRCLDTLDAFSQESIQQGKRSVQAQQEWISTMTTLASSVEDRLFKTLRTLVKIEESKNSSEGTIKASYKDIYRSALAAKLEQKTSDDAVGVLVCVHAILQAAKDKTG